MRLIRKLPDAEALIRKYSLSPEQMEKRKSRIAEIQQVLAGTDPRKLLIIGPCSADREDAVLVYTERLAALQEKVKVQFLIIPRIYTAKPRTTGIGYKGLLHSPSSFQEKENLWSGIIAMRKMHLHVVESSGFFCADEMLYPEIVYYCMDILAYLTVGARSVEDQAHRMMASAVDMPVGMKNPVSGNWLVMMNSIMAAQHEQMMIFHGWEVYAEGNSYAHAVIRGFQDNQDHMHPNYHFEDLRELHDVYRKTNLKNMAVIVDCNHCNSGKNYAEQIRIAREICQSCRQDRAIDRLVKGLMIESYLEDGSQLVGGGVFGKSITDGCLGWNKTEALILSLAEQF